MLNKALSQPQRSSFTTTSRCVRGTSTSSLSSQRLSGAPCSWCWLYNVAEAGQVDRCLSSQFPISVLSSGRSNLGLALHEVFFDGGASLLTGSLMDLWIAAAWGRCSWCGGMSFAYRPLDPMGPM